MKSLWIDIAKIIDRVGEEILFSGPVEIEPTSLGEKLIEFPKPAEALVKFSGVSRGVLVRGQALGHLRLRCGRCLDKFDLDVELDIEEMAIPGGDQTKGDNFPIEDGKVDLAAIIYQNIMVAVPLRLVCRDDCAGLCSVCGRNLNEELHKHSEEDIDGRMAPLKKYFKKR